MRNAIRIHPHDNVCTLLCELSRGEEACFSEKGRVLVRSGRIPAWHKVAICDIPAGAPVLKYGHVVAVALADIPAGCWVDERNVVSPGAAGLR